ncbi:hypothetical protein PENTCL1PPCAC_2712, partial [Pristionchus entomophagus]
ISKFGRFFKLATTQTLRVNIMNGVFDKEAEVFAHGSFKTLDVKKKLEVDFINGYSGRKLIDLIRGSRHIEEVFIRWQRSAGEELETQRALLSLPLMDKRQIIENKRTHPILNDEVLLHLTTNCAKSLDIQWNVRFFEGTGLSIQECQQLPRREEGSLLCCRE